MNFLYNIIIHIYIFSIRIASLFDDKAKLWLKGRKNIWENINNTIKNQKDIVWFHCASLGEFEQGKNIIKEYKKKYKKHKILLTFFSPSGYEIKKDTKIVDFVFYLPADTYSNAKKFIRIIKPIKAIFIKYEYWFNYMQELKNKNIPLYLVSSIFNKNQYFFKYKWFSKQLKNVNHFFIQDKKSQKLLNNIELYNTTISGDSRFDTVIETYNNQKKIPLIKEFCNSKKTIIYGSIWPEEKKILIKFIKNHSEYNHIIVPHELSFIDNMKKHLEGNLYSKMKSNKVKSNNILIIDSIGILSSIYKYGDIAYIGGGFGKGIHNILEAAVFNIPVIFGPKYQRFKEARELIKINGARSIKNYQELVVANEFFIKKKNNIGNKYIIKNTGATNIILQHI